MLFLLFKHCGEAMGRRQTMMEKYKIQMKAYRKKRMKSDSTPYLPPEGTVYVIDSLDPGKKMQAQVVKTKVKSQRTVIESLACPECKNEMLPPQYIRQSLCLWRVQLCYTLIL